MFLPGGLIDEFNTLIWICISQFQTNRCSRLEESKWPVFGTCFELCLFWCEPPSPSAACFIHRENQRRRVKEMLTHPSDSLAQIIFPMDEDAIAPNPVCSAPPQSEPAPPFLPLSYITPRYSCCGTFCFCFASTFMFCCYILQYSWFRNYKQNTL